MCLESAQLLSTSGKHHFPGLIPLYRPTHQSHPAVLWLNEDIRHFAWLFRHAQALHAEYCYRFDKGHASLPVVMKYDMPSIYKHSPPDHFYNGARHRARRLDFTWIDDVHLAYRIYLHVRRMTSTRPIHSDPQNTFTRREHPGYHLNGEVRQMLARRAQRLIKQESGKSGRDLPCPQCGNDLVWRKNPICYMCNSPYCLSKGALTWGRESK